MNGVKSMAQTVLLHKNQLLFHFKLNFNSFFFVFTEIDVDNINMDYVNEGLAFPHNRDRDGKLLFIFKSRLHIRGMRDSKELIRIFVYWMERMYR